MFYEKLLWPFLDDQTKGARIGNRDTSKKLTEVVQVKNIYGWKEDVSKGGENSQIPDVFLRPSQYALLIDWIWLKKEGMELRLTSRI